MKQIHYHTEITTEATQPSNNISEIDKRIWKKIVEIFLNVLNLIFR